MEHKTLLILVDGMRPDAMLACGNPYVEVLLAESTYTLKGRTVMPSVTLPCHMSLFHAVDPERHGILTNVYTPQTQPVEGLFERLAAAGKRNAIFYNWEQLRDLDRPGCLECSVMLDQHRMTDTDQMLSSLAVKYINQMKSDFVFLYLGETDERGGHAKGWMSETYLMCVSHAIDCVKKIREGIPSAYDLILTADHGGHERIHGTDRDEDMNIPLVLNGPSFQKNHVLETASIKDIAPTVTTILQVQPAPEWEGKSLV